MSPLRRFATPITVGSFLLMAVTGILMFFHIDSGLNKLAHEWLGWVMVAGVGLHVLLNWRAFTLYFKRPLANALMGGFAAVLALSFINLGGDEGNGRPDLVTLRMLTQAPIETLAPVLGTDPASLLVAMQAHGVEARQGQSLAQAMGGEMRPQVGLIATLSAEFAGTQ